MRIKKAEPAALFSEFENTLRAKLYAERAAFAKHHIEVDHRMTPAFHKKIIVSTEVKFAFEFLTFVCLFIILYTVFKSQHTQEKQL